MRPEVEGGGGMTNQQQYEELCEKAEMCDKYKAALHGIMDDLLTYARSLSLVGIYNDNVLYCLEIVKKHVLKIESGEVGE